LISQENKDILDPLSSESLCYKPLALDELKELLLSKKLRTKTGKPSCFGPCGFSHRLARAPPGCFSRCRCCSVVRSGGFKGLLNDEILERLYSTIETLTKVRPTAFSWPGEFAVSCACVLGCVRVLSMILS
jgi:hypothetical protein